MCTTYWKWGFITKNNSCLFFTSCILAGITASRNVNSIACAHFETRCSTEKQCSVCYVSWKCFFPNVTWLLSFFQSCFLLINWSLKLTLPVHVSIIRFVIYVLTLRINYCNFSVHFSFLPNKMCFYELISNGFFSIFPLFSCNMHLDLGWMEKERER